MTGGNRVARRSFARGRGRWCAWQESNLLPFGPETYSGCPAWSPHLPIAADSYLRSGHVIPACPRLTRHGTGHL